MDDLSVLDIFNSPATDSSLILYLSSLSLPYPLEPAIVGPVGRCAAVASLVGSKAASLGEYDVLFALAESGRLPHPPADLISTLSDNDRADLVCSVLRQAADLRSSKILAALCFFRHHRGARGREPAAPKSGALSPPWRLSPRPLLPPSRRG